jgi:thymidylate kinase
MTSLYQLLDKTEISYCILHGWQGLPEYLPSDLDIVVAPEDLPRFEESLLHASGARLVNLLQHESTCYYFVIALEDGEKTGFIPVDAATDYRRDGRVWFSAKELLDGRQEWNGFWVTAPEVEFKYLLVKKILKQGLPEHAQVRLGELASSLGSLAESEAERLLGRQWGSRVTGWIRDGKWQEMEAHLPRLKKVLKWERLKREPLNALRYWLPELTRIWRRWRQPTGLWVAVLGPDGAGKSTLIEGLQKEVAGAFRRTAQFHLMPALLRRQGDGGPVTYPHGKPPRSWLASLLKLSYYWLDYNLGYLLKVRPALAKSTLVLFDRYYDDLLIDPRRYRYGGPTWAARLLRRLIPRPDIFLVLDVPREKLLERKQEVAPEELERQVRAYREFAANTPNAVLLDGSASVEEVVAQARDALLEHLRFRYLNRRPHRFLQAKGEDLAWLSEVLGVAFRPGRSTHTFLRLPEGRGYLLPLASAGTFRSGLSLYPAQTAKARAARDALRALAFLGLKAPGLPKVYLEDQDSKDSVLQTLRDVFGRKDLVFAVSLGTPGPHRKPVIQVMTSSGEVLGYAKVGWNEATRALVENEARVLQMLQGEDLPFAVPRVLYGDCNGERALCVQGSPPVGARAATQELTAEYVEVLSNLARRNLCRRPLEESRFWQRIIERVQRVRKTWWQHGLHHALQAVRQDWQDREVPFHFAHGDFAPWNALRTNGRLYLFDWEYAQEEAPAGYDLSHFLVQTFWLVNQLEPREIGKAVLNQAMQRFMKGYWDLVYTQVPDIPRLFRLYLLDRISCSLTTAAVALDSVQDLMTIGAQVFAAHDDVELLHQNA